MNQVNRNYLISLEEKNKSGCYYVIPFNVIGINDSSMTLEEIDKFSQNKLEYDLIKKVISSNIYPNLASIENLYLTIIYKDKKIRSLPFIDKKHKEILDIDIASFLHNDKNTSILYNYFKSYLKKAHISNNFKEFVVSLKENKNRILLNLNNLTYEEKRELKIYISKNITL